MEVRSTLVPAQKYPTLSELEHSDWRYEFPNTTRRRICNHIENLFRKYFTGSSLLNVLPVIAMEFEARIFYSMTESEADYLRKLIFKLFSIIGYLEPTFKDGQMESSSSTQSANQTNPELRIPPTTGHGSMPQTSHRNAVPPDVHRNPTTSALHHDGKGIYLNRMPENSATRTGTHIQGQDWQAETLEEINYLVRTYGKRFWDVYYWAKDGPENRGRSMLQPGLLEENIDELDLIAKIFLLTQKESISIELKKYVQYIEKRILSYIDLKVSSDSSEEIYSKLETSSPNKNQKLILNELIKAFLMDKAKKLGVYIHLVNDDNVGYIISYSLQKEIVEIINDWCDHKLRTLTQARPTMRDIENELSIWQMPGSKLQQWCLLKHLPMKVGPARQRPDPLLEKVRSIWKMPDNELQQPSPSQQQLQQQVNPARQPAVPVPQQVGPAKKWSYATLQKGRPIPQFQRMMDAAAPCLVLRQPLSKPQKTRPCFLQLQHYLGSPLQRTGAAQMQPVVVPMQQTSTLCGRSKKGLSAIR